MIITVYTHEPLCDEEMGGVLFSGEYVARLVRFDEDDYRLTIMEPDPHVVGGWRTVRAFAAREWKGYTVQNRRGSGTSQRQGGQASSAGTGTTTSAPDRSTEASGTSSSAPAPAIIPGGCA